jgi:hypothetical protein
LLGDPHRQAAGLVGTIIVASNAGHPVWDHGYT